MDPPGRGGRNRVASAESESARRGLGLGLRLSESEARTIRTVGADAAPSRPVRGLEIERPTRIYR